MVIPVVKAAFMPLSAIKGNPANAGVTRLCGISPCPVPDTATALPKQARYQLRNTPVDGRSGGGAIQGACADAGLAEIIIMYEAGFCKRRKNLRAVFTGHGWFAIIIHIDNGKGARENENAKKAEPGAADGAV